MKTILTCLTVLLVVPALVMAQQAQPVVARPAAPVAAAPVVAPAANLGAEIELLKNQVNQFQTNVQTVKSNVQPVVESIQKLHQIGESYPKAVADFKVKYEIPANATASQEVEGVSRALLEKSGLKPEQAKLLTKSVKGAADQARQFKPLAPESIMISVGVAAGMNVLGQLGSSGKIDLTQTVKMLADKGFWGGLIGSSVGYSAAAWALARFLPPGGGLIAAFLPTFGAMTASLLGGELGAKGITSGFKEALSQISIPEILAQAAGSTIGMFAGAQMVTSLTASLGAMAGPLGMVLGGLVGGQLGLWAVRSVKALFTGKDAATDTSLGGSDVPSAASILRPSPDLPAGTIMTTQKLQELRTNYQGAYQAWVESEKIGDQKASLSNYSRLTALKREYELGVRQVAVDVKDGHTAPR